MKNLLSIVVLIVTIFLTMAIVATILDVAHWRHFGNALIPAVVSVFCAWLFNRELSVPTVIFSSFLAFVIFPMSVIILTGYSDIVYSEDLFLLFRMLSYIDFFEFVLVALIFLFLIRNIEKKYLKNFKSH